MSIFKIGSPSSQGFLQDHRKINNILKNFQDTDGYPLFSGSKIETVVDLSGRMDATLSINISKQLLESGYSISYIDPEDILVICTQEEGDDGTLFFFSNYEKIYKYCRYK